MSDFLKKAIFNNMSGFIEFCKLHQDGQIHDLKTDDEYRNKLTTIIDRVFSNKNYIITSHPTHKDWFLKTLSIKLFELGSYYAEIPGYVDQAEKYFNNAFQIINPEDIADSLIELYTKSAEEKPMPFYEKFRRLCQYDGINSDILNNNEFRTELEFNIGIIHQHLNKIIEELSQEDTQDLIQNLNDITSKLEQYYNNFAMRLISENFELSFKYFERAENYTRFNLILTSKFPEVSRVLPPTSSLTTSLKNQTTEFSQLIQLGSSPTQKNTEEPTEQQLSIANTFLHKRSKSTTPTKNSTPPHVRDRSLSF